MEQSPSWEAKRFSASQEIPSFVWNHEGSLPQSQVPATCPYPEPARKVLKTNNSTKKY
jgi:hypothetical protein